jgi:hypothetical protein
VLYSNTRRCVTVQHSSNSSAMQETKVDDEQRARAKLQFYTSETFKVRTQVYRGSTMLDTHVDENRLCCRRKLNRLEYELSGSNHGKTANTESTL